MLISAVVFLALGLLQAVAPIVVLAMMIGLAADWYAGVVLARKSGVRLHHAIASIAVSTALYRFGAYVVGWFIARLFG